MGFMMSIVTVGSVVLQSAINEMGYLVIAGHLAARKIIIFCMLPVATVPVALSTFVSQNKGADQREHIRKGVRYGNIMIMVLIWVVFMSIVLMFTAQSLVHLISGSKENIILENGSKYLSINVPFSIVLGMLLNFRFALQGVGKKIVPLISSVIELVGKVIFVYLLIPTLGYFGVIICEPAIWCVMFVQLLYSFYTNPYIRGKAITEKAITE